MKTVKMFGLITVLLFSCYTIGRAQIFGSSALQSLSHYSTELPEEDQTAYASSQLSFNMGFQSVAHADLDEKTAPSGLPLKGDILFAFIAIASLSAYQLLKK